MKAWQIRGEYGIDKLQRVEVPEPTAGEGQVVVAMRAASLNFRDLVTVRGFPGAKAPPALVPCSDGAGVVHSVGAGVRGVLPEEERTATGLAQHLLSGRLEDLTAGGYGVILGSALAHELHAGVGEDIVLIAPEGTATPTGVVPRMRRFHVVALFSSGMYEFDRGLALIHLEDAARLFRSARGVTGLRLAFTDPLHAPTLVRQIARRVSQQLGIQGFYVSDWTQDHANFFRSIEITKSMLFVILLMLVAVAAFNIVATLVMIVKEKQTDIAILRTLGAAPRNVLLTFAVQGVLIGLAGTLAGAALGTLVEGVQAADGHVLQPSVAQR